MKAVLEVFEVAGSSLLLAATPAALKTLREGAQSQRTDQVTECVTACRMSHDKLGAEPRSRVTFAINVNGLVKGVVAGRGWVNGRAGRNIGPNRDQEASALQTLIGGIFQALGVKLNLSSPNKGPPARRIL